MPSFEQHCRESAELFGDQFGEIHRWLDAFAFKPPFGLHHRRVRHHEAGIAEVRKLYGEKAAAAARQHIISDLRQEGWKETDSFPKDELDYVRMGLV